MLQIRNLTITHLKDLKELVKDLSLTVNQGDKVAIIGEEGNGKSTLLKLLLDERLVSSYVSYSGQKYDKVILHVSKAIPDNIKEALSKQDVSTVKKEMLSLIEEALGLKEAVNITGLDLKTDMTAEEISLEMTIDPENLDYEAAKKLPNYAQLFEQIETLTPEELLNKFKGSDGVEVPASN